MDKSTTLPLSHQPTVALPAMSAPPPAAPSTIESIDLDDPTGEDGAPSRLALLQRAAALGPGPRLTLDTIMFAPTDPILAKKREPGVIERRTRFRRVVKVAVGLCAGFCLFATAATAATSSKAPESTGSSSAVAHSTAPASVVSEKQTLVVANTIKAEKGTYVAPAPHGRRAKR